jgi:L-histidine Nalpha-methyltransferase
MPTVRKTRPKPIDEVLAGLRAPHKHLPCKLLYDERGAELFDRICDLDAYYLTREELALLEARLPDIAAAVGERARVIEPGSGVGKKTRMLLSALQSPVGYVPIDVSGEQLEANAAALRVEYPALEIQPVHGDYTQPIALPAPTRAAAATLAFFPGSTIGNFEPADARAFLAELGKHADMLLLGADTNENVDELLVAYDDPEGVTAAFDLNMLAHLNRTHGATFDLDAFMHRAIWNAAHSRIEMHLVSRRRQNVDLAGETIRFDRGEAIVTEYCYKHAPAALAKLVSAAGWTVRETYAGPRMRLVLAQKSAKS